MPPAPTTTTPPLFLVWKRYQRRAATLAPLIGARLLFFPHRFRSRAGRPLDYISKFARSLHTLRQEPPSYVIVQAPPPFAALPSYLLDLPYVLDAHNTVIRSGWTKLPLSKRLIRNARGLIAHNEEILTMMREDFPEATFFHIPDPVPRIQCQSAQRHARQITFICSFDDDEPIDSIIRTIELLPDYTFVITADPNRLSRAQRQRLVQCSNLRLPGYLDTEAYHALLCSSRAVVTLTTRAATQQSGACEALASNTPLITSRTTLSEALFGDWATLVANTAESIVEGIRSAPLPPLDLATHRDRWNRTVQDGVNALQYSLESERDRRTAPM